MTRRNRLVGGLAAVAVAVVLIAIAGVWGLVSWLYPPTVPDLEPSVRPVRSEVVAEHGGVKRRSLPGVTQDGGLSRLSFKVGGTVVEVPVEVGQRVTADEPVARLDDADLRLQLAEARAALAQVDAQVGNAEAQHARIRQLYVSQDASQAQLDAARAAFDSARAARASVAQRLGLARSQVENTLLTAPVDGAVAEVLVNLGENVAPGQPVAVLTSGGEPEVRVAVPESLIAEAREGSSATVRVEALDGATFVGTVSEIGVTPTRGGTTFPLTIRLTGSTADGPGLDALRAGMSAVAELAFGRDDAPSRILVPAVAIAEDRDGQYGFVLEPGDAEGLYVATRTPVAIGELTPDGLEITDGLVAGQRVVTAGLTRIRAGQVVRLLPGAEAP